MYYQLKKEWREQLFRKIIEKLGNNNRAINKMGMEKSAYFAYKNGSRTIPQEILVRLVKIASENLKKEYVQNTFPDNWRQILGGKKCVESKKRKGTFESQMKECHKASSNFMKKHHKKWKDEDPHSYYISQYEKFKKIGGYKYKTIKGEYVRNLLEKTTADSLYKMKIPYKYEPCININKKFFFPDFILNNNIIIECTMWRGYDKAIKLKEKINYRSEE